jgi:uncharacterized protein (TIGR01319 family)
MHLSNTDAFVITDIGSTTTKSVLFVKEDGRWSFLREEAPTTVEKPYEDVAVGVTASLAALDLSHRRAGRGTLLENGTPCVPFLATSSAGGGLAMVVTGLVKEFTAETADRVALGAGAIVLDVTCMNDGRTAYRKIEDLKRLRPDMVLLAGGFDGEAITAPVFLAELLVESDLHPKLNPESLLPVVYAGNVNASAYVEQALGERFLFEPVPNVRPTEDDENPRPARAAIHRLFMDHVMSQAPGYEKIKPWVEVPIRPTPAAFAKILEVVSRELGTNVLAIDIGGATTDVFTASEGSVFRTVSANLGMSYSALNVLELVGPRAIAEFVDFEIKDSEIWNRVGNKHVNPTVLPESSEDILIERAVATMAIRAAVRDHLTILGGEPKDERPGTITVNEMLKGPPEERDHPHALAIRDYDLVIGSGGILSHSLRSAAAKILLDALRPAGPVELAVDSAFLFPHLGVLAEVSPGLARDLFFDLGLVRLGTFDPETGGDAALKETLAKDAQVLNPRAWTAHSESKEELRTRGSGVVRDRLLERRELAIEGEVFVALGDIVTPDTVVARSVRQFLRPFFLNVTTVLKVPPEDIGKVLLVGIGDEVGLEQVIAEAPGKFGTKRFYRSPVEGRIEKILPDGTVVVRERPELARVLTTVQVAKDLGVRPERVKPYLKVALGDDLERGQWLAAIMHGTAYRVSKSPVRGRVNRIDERFGMVMIEPLLEEEEVLAWLPGTVREVSARGCVVEAEGARADGVWGWGGEAFGPLRNDEFETGAVVLCDHLDRTVLEMGAEVRVAGIVAAGAELRDILDVQPQFTIVVMEGFGSQIFPHDVARLLVEHEGRVVLLDGTTQLRVGVRRPRVVLPGVEREERVLE